MTSSPLPVTCALQQGRHPRSAPHRWTGTYPCACSLSRTSSIGAIPRHSPLDTPPPTFFSSRGAPPPQKNCYITGTRTHVPFCCGIVSHRGCQRSCPCARTVEWLTPQYFNKRFVRGVLGSNPSVVRRFFREEKLWARRVWRRRGRGVWYRRRGVGLRPCGGGDPPLWRRVAH